MTAEGESAALRPITPEMLSGAVDAVQKAVREYQARQPQISRQKIQDAIIAWREGASYDAIHPLAGVPNEHFSIFWDDNALKDLARVIAHTLLGEDVPNLGEPY